MNTLFGYPATLCLRDGEHVIEIEGFLTPPPHPPELSLTRVIDALAEHERAKRRDVSHAAVEAAAKALYEHTHRNCGCGWAGVQEGDRKHYLDRAKLALDAARDAGVADGD